MGTFEFVITIVSLALGFALLREFVRRRHHSTGAWEKWLEESGLDATLDRLDALERRVVVLERIATDKSQHISEEIEGL